MHAFEFASAATVEEALALLAGRGDARVLGGGTDLVAQLREGRRRAARVVDVKGIAELAELAASPRTGLRLGAAVPCRRIYGDPAVVRLYPGLVDSARLIGGTAIQGRASFGGNLCNASPAADAVPAMIAHDVRAIVAGPRGRRAVPVEAFCTAPGATVLDEGELLVSLHAPPPPPRSGARYLRFIPRGEMDIAVVGVGVSLALEADGRTIARARVALGAVAPTPLLAEEAGAFLAGRAASGATLDEAARIARDAARPIDDMRGTARQRRHLAGVLTRRALAGALERARA